MGSYLDDKCPLCGSPCIQACRCPLNDRMCENKHWWRRDKITGRPMLLDGPHGSEIEPPSIENLTFDMKDKADDEMWDIVQEACRVNTPAWRSYERLRSKYGMMVRTLNSVKGQGGV